MMVLYADTFIAGHLFLSLVYVQTSSLSTERSKKKKKIQLFIYLFLFCFVLMFFGFYRENTVLFQLYQLYGKSKMFIIKRLEEKNSCDQATYEIYQRTCTSTVHQKPN